MKTNPLIRLLLGAFLALPVCASGQYSVKVLSTAFSASAVAAGQRNIKDSPYPTFMGNESAVSVVDGSSISCSESATSSSLVFTGSGEVSVSTGVLNGLPNLDASGGTSAYILLQTTGMYSYELAATLFKKGNVAGQVSFNGMTNPAGNRFITYGNLAPGLHELIAGMSVGPDISGGRGSWSYSLSLRSPNIPPAKLGAAQKGDFLAQWEALQGLQNQLLAEASASSSAAERDGLLKAAKSIKSLADQLATGFADPPDTNYTVLAQAVAPTVQPVAVGGSITQPEADFYNAWLTNLVLSAGYCTVFITSLNRAQGAATDGNAYWENAQMGAAVNFGAQLATLFDQEPVLRSNVVAQFAAGGFPPITLSTNDANALQMQTATNGLPQVLVDGLTALGLDPATITNIEYSLLAADPSFLAGSFPVNLANPNLDATTHTLAAGLRDASLMLINASVLPGGQFRFDLPTEPGYTYSIQFTENLAQRATWATIFTTNATTSLLSFTNTPAGVPAAGFYRATHN